MYNVDYNYNQIKIEKLLDKKELILLLIKSIFNKKIIIESVKINEFYS